MAHLRAVVFDWAGTVIDYGSCAPMGAFVETFAAFGVEISIAEARVPMGMAKRPHIAALLAQPRIRAAWTARHGTPPGEAEIDALYAMFLPRNVAAARRYATLIPGAADVVARLRAMGLRIGSTTGYTHEIMAEIIPLARAQGFAADCVVCTGDTPQGRPSPMMMWRAMIDLDVWPASRVVKVDDTGVGIGEGLAAGAWTVGVAVSGNSFGCTEDEIRAMDAAEFADRRARAHDTLRTAGAHAVIDSVADLLPVIRAFDAAGARGEAPGEA
ncbi:phosphonoacetaldehyde hydrolase [Gluconacetobacter tumulisoli]|uniref:Phosphonoacetaldehyde hydrolase n=1 Tax=Gluconacetobacter tumulisoli TaxID=1286189 RepID=A0A7W4K552_9PROT|nr:phosphonoacetaldehyde hydrolase [Gluconacetobacter tumulisoli]MBB2200578.1 phosphonoacetaldehyde hydrolase [Gluconacetobacter tumulisoli]